MGAGFGIFNPATNQYLTVLADALTKTAMLPAKQQTTVPVFESVFGAGMAGIFYVQPSAGGTISRNNGTGTIDEFKIGSDAWHVPQLVKGSSQDKKDSRYLVTIKAASDVPVSLRTMSVPIPGMSYSGYPSIS